MIRTTMAPRHLAALALLAVVYFASARLGLLAAVAQPVVSSAWPAAGVALAALLLFGLRFWPGVAVGAFLLNASAGVPLAGAAGIAVGNTLEAVVGAVLLQRVARFRPSLDRLQDVLALALLGAVGSTAVSATIGVGSLWSSGLIPAAAYGSLWLVWWSGDAIGLLVFAPLFLTWAATPRPREPLRRALEAATLVLALVALTHLFFQSPFSYVYAIFPVASWAALRFGPRGAATATVLVSSLAVWYTVRGLGPFVSSTPTHDLFLLQTFMALLSVTALILAAVIAERTRAEDALRASEAHYRVLFESNPNPLWVYDAATLAFLAVNEAAVRHYGYSREEFLGMTLLDIRPPEGVPALRALAAKAVPGHLHAGEWRHRKKDGTVIDVEVTRHTLAFAGRCACLAMAHDITERKRVETRFRGLLEAAPDGMVILGQDGRIVLVNAQAERLFGYARAELVGTPVEMLVPERFRGVHADHRASYLGDPRTRFMGTGLVLYGLRKDGSEFPAEICLSPMDTGDDMLVTAAIRDITERKALEEQLRQSQRLEAVGQLAAGIAHDFNNLLTAIIGYSELLLRDLPPEDRNRGAVGQVVKAAEHAASLTRQLLAFSRRQILQPKVLDLNAVVGGTDSLLRRLIGEHIDLLTVLDPALGRVKADPGQLEQVMLNLAVNARDAMPGGGKLTIETANVELDEGYAARHVGVRPGRYVLLAVSDTGLGMDRETRARIFEPFFTTKGKDKGTGLGLATVYGIVKQSGGSIWCYSAPGRGTTFKVYLPRVEEAIDPQTRSAMTADVPRGSETVLLVEDEEVVRALAREVLRRSGYTVLEARNGGEAAGMAERYEGPIHLMLTDVVLPEASGHELAERLAPSRPEMKVLYMSGYTDNAIVRHGVLEPGIAFLQKPFSAEALARKVRAVLDG